MRRALALRTLSFPLRYNLALIRSSQIDGNYDNFPVGDKAVEIAKRDKLNRAPG